LFSVFLGLFLAGQPLVAGTINTFNGDGEQWSSTGFWSEGAVPSGTDSANIFTDVTVLGSSTLGATDYTGNLTLNAGAYLNLDGGSDLLVDHLPSVSTSNIFLYHESKIFKYDGTGAVTLDNPIVLYGGATFEARYSADRVNFNGPISGNGSLTFRTGPWDTNGDTMRMVPSAPNTYSGGTEVVLIANGNGRRFYVNSDGALGTGDLRVKNEHTSKVGYLDFSGTTSDVIDDSKELWLEDTGGGGLKLDLNNNNETVRVLMINGVEQNPSGYPDTWGRIGGGANNQSSYFDGGSGILTVTGGTDVSSPWPNPMTLTEPPSGNSLTSILLEATTASDLNTVEYFFENITSGTNSGYQSGITWHDSGLTAGTNYVYRIKARDSLGNETEWSRSYTAHPTELNNFINDTGNWNVGGSWSKGVAPTGTESANITAGYTVNSSASFSTDYVGDLHLREGVTFNIDPNSHNVEDHLPSQSTSEIHIYQGVLMYFNNAGGEIYNDIVLHGDAEIKNYWTPTDLICGISGSGQLTISVHGGGGQFVLQPPNPNTFTGGTILNGQRAGSNDTVQVSTDGAFGTGHVTLQNRVFLDFTGATTDVIDDLVYLYINDNSTLDLNSNSETVGRLIVDGVVQPRGTYTSSESYIQGSGTLTVNGPVSGTIILIK